jgi:hypothetical protein
VKIGKQFESQSERFIIAGDFDVWLIKRKQPYGLYPRGVRLFNDLRDKTIDQPR